MQIATRAGNVDFRSLYVIVVCCTKYSKTIILELITACMRKIFVFLFTLLYLSVMCSGAPSLLQLMTGGGNPSAGQRMVSDCVVLVRSAESPMFTSTLSWTDIVRFCCCLMILGLCTAAPPRAETSSDQLWRLSVVENDIKHQVKQESLRDKDQIMVKKGQVHTHKHTFSHIFDKYVAAFV